MEAIVDDREFQSFGKIARLNREMIVTEKIDGTNAQIAITRHPEQLHSRVVAISSEGLVMRVGSRNRWITPDDDNFGFAAWAKEHRDELFALGSGRHYGEWWGKGIQRGYDAEERRFSLFNAKRWHQFGYPVPGPDSQPCPRCCHVVPILYTGKFSTTVIHAVIESLRLRGSFARAGYMKPEGIIALHSHSGTLFKATLERDDVGKEDASTPAVVHDLPTTATASRYRTARYK